MKKIHEQLPKVLREFLNKSNLNLLVLFLITRSSRNDSCYFQVITKNRVYQTFPCQIFSHTLGKYSFVRGRRH